MSSREPTTRAARYATLAFLAITLGPVEAPGQGMACLRIEPGDTAAKLAWRLTGDAGNTGQPRFQILNPSTGRFVSKSTYGRIQAGWQACLVDVRDAAAESDTARRPMTAGWADSLWPLTDLDSTVVLWGLLTALIAFVIHSGNQYLRERHAMLAAMKGFAAAFVREFEKPLIEPGAAERPIRSQVRFTPHRARVEVLLAPNGRRRYPNLTDHRTNVEYDVVRVLRSLNDRSFLIGRPYAQGRWVVVPFQRTVESTEAGAR